MPRSPRAACQMSGAIGLSVSILLFAITYYLYMFKLDFHANWEDAMFWLQMVGFFMGWGFPPLLGYIVWISVNALIYSGIAFGILSLIHRFRKI